VSNNISLNAGDSAIVSGSTNNIGTGATSSFIGGGHYNSIQNNSLYSFIGGGNYNNIQQSNLVSTIAGGYSNTIASTSSGTNGIVASAVANVIGGGAINLITNASFATISGGSSNIVNNNYATVPGGQQAMATNYAQLAYSSGMFQNPGDSQHSLFVLRGQTASNNNPQNLYLDGQTLEIALGGNRACTFTARVIGRAAGNAGDCCAFSLEGVANNSSVMFVGPQPMNQIYGGLVPPAPTISDGSDGKLHVQVTGDGVNSIRWTATIETAEVSF
jgi:hypothetical protein